MTSMTECFLVFSSLACLWALCLKRGDSAPAQARRHPTTKRVAHFIRQLQPLCPCAECQKRGVE